MSIVLFMVTFDNIQSKRNRNKAVPKLSDTRPYVQMLKQTLKLTWHTHAYTANCAGTHEKTYTAHIPVTVNKLNEKNSGYEQSCLFINQIVSKYLDKA